MKLTQWRLQKAKLIALAVSMTSASTMATPAFVEIGHSVDYLQAAADSRFAKIDIDGDGLQDLVFAGTSGSPVLLAVGRRADGSVGIKMAKVVADDGNLARVLAWNAAGVNHILTVSANGMVRDYSGWPLVEQRHFDLAINAVAAAVGDIDNNGSDDLLVGSAGFLFAYSLTNGQPEWNYPISGIRDVAAAQLDADPALEIILAGPVPGIVIDGAIGSTDWQYIDGFGTQLATGSLLSGGGTQWVAASDWNLFTVFRASPWSPIWSGSTSQDIGGIATANLDNNGRDAILQGDGQWGQVHVIDPDTHNERFQIPNEGYGIGAVVGADLDGDGKDEIAFASNQAPEGKPLLTIAGGQSGSVGWQFFPIDGPFIATALGDVDGDGHMELVAAGGVGNGDGTISIFDAETGAEEWRSPTKVLDVNDPLYLAVTKIELVPHAETQGMDIVLAGGTEYAGRITVLDGMTHSIRLQIGGFSSGPMLWRSLKDLALVDFDSDGILDYVAATEPVSVMANGALLQVFSGDTGGTLWTSVSMGSVNSGMNGVLVAGGSSGKQLIAVLPDSLRAYDSSTGLLSWTIAIPNNGAFLVPNGENGAEIGVFQDAGEVTFYSASTQALIRSYSMPAPLRAMSALGGDLHTLVAASADALTLVDGESGSILAATDYLGPFPAQGSRIAVAANSTSSWTIASGTEAALYRFRLNLTDVIFANSFENP
ncbi:MAG: VCBS repeat-containing protein [Xanthomonadales bacterium]|nr:VCBS repeat-containing protein [Xanthomonadales bacterium]